MHSNNPESFRLGEIPAATSDLLADDLNFGTRGKPAAAARCGDFQSNPSQLNLIFELPEPVPTSSESK